MRRELLDGIPIYLVTDSTPRFGPPEEFLARIIEAGVGMVQLREKRLPDRELFAIANLFATTCRFNGALFIVNDRVDVAMFAGADGVHVGQTDAHPDDIRKIAGQDFLIGLSTHSPEQVDAANASCADYIAVGPVHQTPTKPGASAVGVELVSYAASRAAKPFFAIGGINAGNVAAVRDAGAKSIAVVRHITEAEDPARAVRELLEAILQEI